MAKPFVFYTCCCNFQRLTHLCFVTYVSCRSVVHHWTGSASLKRRRLESTLNGWRISAPAKQAQRQSWFGLPLEQNKAVADQMRIVQPLDVFDASLVQFILVHCASVLWQSQAQVSSSKGRGAVHTIWRSLVSRQPSVPAHDVVSSATAGMTVIAENTIDQADRKTEFPELDPGEVKSLFTAHHVKMAGFCHGDQAHRTAS